MSGTLLALVLALSAAESRAELERLRFLLDARARSIESVAMAYEAAQPDAGGHCEWRERGRWFAGHEQRACVALSGCLDEPPTLFWSWWGGVSGYAAGRPATWAEDALLDLGRAPDFDVYEATNRPSSGQLSYAYLPDRLGHGVVNVPWGEYLDVFSDLRVLGREEVAGADCLAVLMDMDRGAADGELSFPWVVHFDDRGSLLALRVTLYAACEEEPPPDPARYRLRIDNRWWRALRTTEVLETAQVEPGLWFGTRGRLVQFTDGDPVVTEVRVDPASIRVNPGLAPWMEAGFRPPAGATVR